MKEGHTTIFVVTDDVMTVEVRGPDRVRFLNGMLTNDVAGLEPGQGHFSVKATNKGRTEGLLRVRVAPDAVFLDLDAASAEQVAGSLVRHLVSDDCELIDRSETWTTVRLVGVGASESLKTVGWPHGMPDMHWVEAEGHHVVRDLRFGVDGYELRVVREQLEDIRRRLRKAVTESEPEPLEVLRIEAGVPRYGYELSLDVIPMEAGLDYAIDYKKGCYIGQETIARATNLGGVRYGMVGFRFGPSVPDRGADLFDAAEGKRVGEVTSTARSERLQSNIGLGFVRLTHAKPETRLVTDDGFEVTVTTLPHCAPTL
ncbi:MAG: YgfZ/GcvT domain-containing protein [Myxococcota bacterium]